MFCPGEESLHTTAPDIYEYIVLVFWLSLHGGLNTSRPECAYCLERFMSMGFCSPCWLCLSVPVFACSFCLFWFLRLRVLSALVYSTVRSISTCARFGCSSRPLDADRQQLLPSIVELARASRFMEVDAAHAFCPDCPATVPVASRAAADEQQEKADTDSRLPSSRRPSRKAVDGGTSSKMSLGKNEGSFEAGRRRLGNKAGSRYTDRKRGRPSVQDSSALFSGAGAASSGVDAGGAEGLPGRRKKQEDVVGDQEEIGPAAAIVEKGGALRWLKLFTSNEGRGEFWDWEGMD